MRSYRINTDKLVNQLVPHYLGGRKLILFLQSCLQPLNSLNNKWKEWADERRIEAAMTSQVIMLEFYLNHKFGKYLQDTTKRIVVSDGSVNGIPIFWSNNETYNSNLALYYENESVEKDSLTAFHFQNERQANSEVSFCVCCPSINTRMISEQELTAMITFQIQKYCIAGKKFNVIYE